MSRTAKAPRVVAELGRPETAAETAARKAENSRLYRQRKTVNNLVFSLLTTVGLALVIFLMVPQGSGSERPAVDYAAVAAQAQLGTPETLAVPSLPSGWKANAAELRSGGDGVTYWYIGLLTPKNGYVGLSQGLDANDTWVANQLDRKAATGTLAVSGTTWTVYDHRDSGDTGNVAYGMAETVGRSSYVVFGTADDDEILAVVDAITPQLGLEH